MLAGIALLNIGIEMDEAVNNTVFLFTVVAGLFALLLLASFVGACIRLAEGSQRMPAEHSKKAGFQQEDIKTYRNYWVFGAIVLLIPLGLIPGIALVLSGDIYKTQNGATFKATKVELWATLVILALLQFSGGFIYR